MWMARQNIFTDYKVKLETDDTKQPSSLRMKATPFYFF